MFAILNCNTCSAALSGRIELLRAVNPEKAGLTFIDGKPLTRPGTGFTSLQPMQWSMDDSHKVPLQFTPQHWLHPDDVEAGIEPVEDPCRLNGCCGLDGSNGPNMRCRKCKAEVGTRQSDCWTADVFIPEPDATSWLKEE